MSRIKTLQNKAKATATLWARLDVMPEDLYKHATITPILVDSLGSIENVIANLRPSDNKIALELLRIWDLGSKNEHKVIPFEAYCLAAKSSPKQMMGIIMETVIESGKEATELMLAAAHAPIVKKTIKIANTKDGADERKIILQNRGTLPAPRNQVFNNFGNLTNDNRKQVANVSIGQLSDDDDKISKAVDEFNLENMKRIGPAKVELVDIVGEE